MDYIKVLNKLKELFPLAIQTNPGSYGFESIEVEKDLIRDVVRYLKEEAGYIFLTDLCGVHYPDFELPFAVVYHLHNFELNRRLRLKVFLSQNPEIDTISDIFASANWMERETYDFYGVVFKGHPNLIRILNVEYLDYFPLRKEYPLEDPTRPDKDDRFFGR